MTVVSFHPSYSLVCNRGKRKKATRTHSDSEASAQFSRGRFAPLSSDSEGEVDDFLVGDDQIDAGRRALPKGVDSRSNPPPDVVDGWSMTSATHPQRSAHCWKERECPHGPRLYVCQAPKCVYMCVKRCPPPNTKCVYMCVTKCVYMCVTKCVCCFCNGARFARLPLLASLARFLTV